MRTQIPLVRHRGFTLLELLIALAVTVSVVALVFTAFASIGKTEQRNLGAMDRAERMAAVSLWLARKFDALHLLSRREADGVVLFFNGNAAGAMWVAPLPERGTSGGLHVIRLTPLRHGSTDVEWVVEAMPYDGMLTQLDWGKAIRETLLQHVTTLQWHYQDGKTGTWTQDWSSSRGVYPARIRIEVGDERGDWPVLTFNLLRAR